MYRPRSGNVFYSTPSLTPFLLLTDNVHGVPFVRLLTVLRSCRDLHYRNMTLFTAISEYVVSTLDMWSNKQVLAHRYTHTHTPTHF